MSTARDTAKQTGKHHQIFRAMLAGSGDHGQFSLHFPHFARTKYQYLWLKIITPNYLSKNSVNVKTKHAALHGVGSKKAWFEVFF